MLARLSIRNFVIVEAVELEFSSGFTVFTGETGAGKSILVDALALVLGERSDASVVKAGADRAEIEAEFSVPDSLALWLSDAELEGDEGVCLLRRTIDATGRSRCWINGRSATLQQLREAGEHLVDIHGQHAHQSLLKPLMQKEMLDTLAGSSVLAGEVSGAYRKWAEARRIRERQEAHREEGESRRGQLEWQVQELSSLSFDPSDWEETLSEQRKLAHAASLVEGTSLAQDVIGESEDSCLARLASIDSRLAVLEAFDPAISPIRSLIDSAQIQLGEALHSLRHYSADLDPERFASLEARIDAVHSIARKYRVKPEELPALLEKSRSELQALQQSTDIEALLDGERAAREHYLSLASKLGKTRREMAKKLSVEVTESMQGLSMAGAAFSVSLEALEEGDAHGLERIEFMVRSHGTEFRPLAKVASGGELSRISLAIQVIGSRGGTVPTLIFDEVDVGIGGGVAEIVGRMLARLGASRQVLCVTHLPQVASQAHHQFSISREKDVSRAKILDDEGRVEEIARMLGGVAITDTTRSHAREMLGFQSSR
ncbi:MAG: DNA repair protein RecN [Burkholderiales bacterium]|nr:DNA repair protein RecN [Burkholderiales bacterium]